MKEVFQKLRSVFAEHEPFPSVVDVSESQYDLNTKAIENGPGYRNGIRNGDKLLKIGELDVTKS